MHYRDVTYHAILASHKVTGASIESSVCSDYAPNVPSEGYHRDVTENKYVVIGCNKSEDFLTSHSDLSGFVPAAYPQWMLDIVNDPLNMTWVETRLLIRDSQFTGMVEE